MAISLSTYFRSFLGFSKQKAASRLQISNIAETLENGNINEVFQETGKILSNYRNQELDLSFPKTKAKFFNSEEEYNSFISKNPSQSYLIWEYPLISEAHYYRALAYKQNGKLASCKRELGRSLLHFPDSAKCLLELGNLLLKMRQYESAQNLFIKTRECDLTTTLRYAKAAEIGLAALMIEIGDINSANRLLTEREKQQGIDAETANSLGLIRELNSNPRQRADYYLDQNNWEAAIVACLEALDYNKYDYEINLGIAFAYKELGELQFAEKHIKAAFKCNPTASEAYFALGWVYMLDENYDAAEQEFNSAIKKNPYDPGYYVGLCTLLLVKIKAGEDYSSKFLATTRKALEIDPLYHDPYLLLTEYYLFTGEKRKARSSIAAALRITKNNQDAHILAAEVYLESGRNRRSEYYLQEAAEYGPDNERMIDLQKRLKSDY